MNDTTNPENPVAEPSARPARFHMGHVLLITAVVWLVGGFALIGRGMLADRHDESTDEAFFSDKYGVKVEVVERDKNRAFGEYRIADETRLCTVTGKGADRALECAETSEPMD